MKDFREYEDALYIARYIRGDSNRAIDIWNDIKNNDSLLKWATKVRRDRFNQKDLVNGLAICDSMLFDSSSVNENVYNELINLIYSNEQIARIVLDGASNGGYSFLLMSLWNHKLKLTDEQKKFAIKEAMFKIGTKYWQKQIDDQSKKLSDEGITDDDITLINIDGYITPVGRKSKEQYINFVFSTLSNNQAHGVGIYDIRYQILSNSNWTEEEKERLVHDFWIDDGVYEEFLEQWEWGIINDAAGASNTVTLEKTELYNYQYNDLLNMYGNKSLVDAIWKQIQFCRLMHKLRPQQWELTEENNSRVLR